MKYRAKDYVIIPNRVGYKIQKKWFIFWIDYRRFDKRSYRDSFLKGLQN
jgi:hypothetical protein